MPVVDTVADRTWLVIPVYNEASVVGDVIAAALKTFPHIVAVDDGSSDSSGNVARAAGAALVTHPINMGQGAALQTGISYALSQPNCDYIVTFDSDGQHQTSDALAMVHELATKPLDVVVGSRFLDDRSNVSTLKRLVLKAAVKFENLSTGLHLTDAHNGLRAFTQAAAQQLHITQNRMAHATEITTQIAENHLRYAEYPVQIVYTDYSRSKGQSIWNSINILSDLWVK